MKCVCKIFIHTHTYLSEGINEIERRLYWLYVVVVVIGVVVAVCADACMHRQKKEKNRKKKLEVLTCP